MGWLVPTLVGVGGSLLAYAMIRALASRVSTPSGPSGRVYVASGHLHGPGGVSVPLTATDRLWLARAVYGETGGTDPRAAAAVIWALAQNLMLVQGTSRPRYSTFTAMIRAYCQPVNPAWAVPGAGKCIQTPSACTPDRIARRAQVSSMSWEQTPPVTRSVVDSFFAGTLANPVPGATDWAAYTFQGATTNVGGNWFGVSPSRRLA